jgi:uncharacterized coiled-coil protein SlyX
MSKTWYLDSRRAVNSAGTVRVVGEIPNLLSAFPHKDVGTYRAELRRLANSGLISEIIFPADVFHQVPNANNFVIPDEELGSFAPSFKGEPFLQDHDQGAIRSRMGTIGKSSLVNNKTISQIINVTSEEGIKAFIDGKIDRFSIGWSAKEAKCSICGDNAYMCEHWPGVSYDKKVCNVVFRGVRGVETSAVNRPAVPGTGLLQQFLSEVKMTKGTVPSDLDTSPENDEELDTQLASNEGDSNSEDELTAFQEALGITDMSELIAQLQTRIGALETQLSEVSERVADYNDQPVFTQVLNSIRKPKAPATVPGHVPTKDTGTERVPFKNQQLSVTQKRAALFLNKLAANKEG